MPRKSKCHQERRNSPSVASPRPSSSCFLMTFAISRSSTALSSAAVMAPFSRLARASLSAAGRRKLPTWSARNGGLVRFIDPAPTGNRPRAKARQPRRRQPQNDGRIVPPAEVGHIPSSLAGGGAGSVPASAAGGGGGGGAGAPPPPARRRPGRPAAP